MCWSFLWPLPGSACVRMRTRRTQAGVLRVMRMTPIVIPPTTLTHGFRVTPATCHPTVRPVGLDMRILTSQIGHRQRVACGFVIGVVRVPSRLILTLRILRPIAGWRRAIRTDLLERWTNGPPVVATTFQRMVLPNAMTRITAPSLGTLRSTRYLTGCKVSFVGRSKEPCSKLERIALRDNLRPQTVLRRR